MHFQRFGYKQKFKGILFDTNLLLLLLVGIFDSKQIQTFKRINFFDVNDFKALLSMITKCNDQLYTTPNILTEITNLSDVINHDYRFFAFIKEFIEEFVEINTDSKTIMTNNQVTFLKLGLTDASIMDLASDDILILTIDLELYHHLSSSSKAVINYNHIKFN